MPACGHESADWGASFWFRHISQMRPPASHTLGAGFPSVFPVACFLNQMRSVAGLVGMSTLKTFCLGLVLRALKEA